MGEELLEIDSSDASEKLNRSDEKGPNSDMVEYLDENIEKQLEPII